MALNLHVVKYGKDFDVFSIEQDDHCLLNEFLNAVCISHEYDFSRLQSIFDRIAETGPLKNPEVFKPLRDDLFEIKVGVLRVVCFQRKHEIFCTHGFVKSSQKTPVKELNTAKWLRSIFLVADARGTVKTIED